MELSFPEVPLSVSHGRLIGQDGPLGRAWITLTDHAADGHVHSGRGPQPPRGLPEVRAT